MVALASSLDCVGIVTRSAADARTVLSALVGRDGRDATSVAHPNPELLAPLAPTVPLRVAVVTEMMQPDVTSSAVLQAVRSAAEALRGMGAEIGEISLPAPDVALASYCVLSAAEAASNLARFDGVRYGRRSKSAEDLYSLYANSRAEGFGVEVKRRILFGTYMLSEGNRALYYDAAVSARERICNGILERLSQYDLILTPTAPTAAVTFGNKRSVPEQRRADLCVVYASLAGLPAVSIPYGRTEGGLPLAVQLTAAPFAEGLLLSVAEQLSAGESGGAYGNA